MIGILLVTHGDFAKGIINAMELICGSQQKVEFLSLNMADDVEVFVGRVKEAALNLNDGDGVLILTDLMGGSPANVVCRFLLEEDHIESVTGLNLPMLLEAVNSREFMKLDELIKACCDMGYSGIANLKEKLAESTEVENEDE